jgi:1,4-dihydroxy-2-naphthoate octaprenyltransferase
MLQAAFIVFGLALFFALPLLFLAGLWSVPVALLCILFGILYTGGPKPLGYLGLGEILVFVFFGPVAVCGSYFLQTGYVDQVSFFASLSPALLSTAILAANNLRDEHSDRKANKKTLVVRWGRLFGSCEYTALTLSSLLIPVLLVSQNLAPKSILLSCSILPLSVPLIKKSFRFKDPIELITLLQGTSFLLFIYTLFFCIAMIW